MKHMLAVVLLTCGVVIISAGAVPPGKTSSGFDRLRGLLGTWKGRDSGGSEMTSTFRIVADETSIMETIVRGDGNETIVRVYYVDNGVLMLTQYGTRGNQPRMRIDPKKTGERTFAFTMLDVTDPAGDNSVQIRDLMLEQRDRSSLAESWTVGTGRKDSVETAVLERTTLDVAGAGLEKMKTLLGSWKGKDGHGNGVDVTYSLVADGTALMESLDIGPSKENMVTLYTLSGGNTVLTHYCSMGNQPRMKLDGPKSDEQTLVYTYVDATNVKSDRDPRMHDLTIRLKDKDHFSQEWTLRIEGKTTSTVYEFERVKEAAQSSGW
jgi:hypothetical protein